MMLSSPSTVSLAAPALPIGVMIVDDHTIVRTGLRALIDAQPGMRVTAEAASHDEALAALGGAHVDVVLLDLDLGEDTGLRLLPELCRVRQLKVLLLTGVRDQEQHRRAVQLGARGVVLKEKTVDVLVKAIRKDHEGELWLDRAMIATLLVQMSRPQMAVVRDLEAEKIASLTPREREVIVLIGQGLKNRTIAERLFISEATVRHHLTSVFGKLGVADRFELVVYAYRHRLVKPLA